MKVFVPEEIGFCFGVRRALQLVEDELRKGGKIYSLGDLIHNPQVVEELQRKGIKTVGELSQIREGTVIIRSHGVNPSLIEEARERGLKVVDTTCPYVLKAQRTANLLVQNSYAVVVVGLREHPEVQGIIGNAQSGKIYVIKNSQEVEKLPFMKKVGVVVQTTETLDNFEDIVKNLIKKTEECRVFNTICKVIMRRRALVRELARKVEAMVVVGGRNSANTRQLVEMCRSIGVDTYFIERKEDLKLKELKGIERIGIIGGTSTPEQTIKEIRDELLSLDQSHNSFKINIHHS